MAYNILWDVDIGKQGRAAHQEGIRVEEAPCPLCRCRSTCLSLHHKYLVPHNCEPSSSSKNESHHHFMTYKMLPCHIEINPDVDTCLITIVQSSVQRKMGMVLFGDYVEDRLILLKESMICLAFETSAHTSTSRGSPAFIRQAV